MIEYIKFKNFRNLIDIEIIPSQGLNLIEGENGQGKSSILQGIKYLLTDELDEKISDYVRWGQDKFIIESKFSFNGHIYEYNIEGSKSSKKELIIDGEEVFKNSEATKKMNEVIDANIIKYANIAEQGKNTQILFEKNTERLKHLKEILGVDKLIPIIEEMKEEEKLNERQVDEYDKEIKILEERQYNFMDVPEIQNIEQIKNEFDLLDKDKQIYESQIKLYEKYKNDKQKYSEAQEKILEVNIQVEQDTLLLNQKKIDIKKDNFNSSIDDLQAELLILEKRNIEQKNNINNIRKVKSKIIELEKSIGSQKELLNKYQIRRITPLKYEKEDWEQADKVLLETEIKIADYEKQLKLAEQGKCPTCGKDYIVDINYIKKEIADCISEKVHFSKCIDLYKEEFNRYEKEINEQEIVKVQRQNIENNIKNLQTELDKLYIDIDCIVDDKDACDYESQIKEIQDKIYQIKIIEEQNKNIEKEIIYLQSKIENNINLIKQYNTILKPEEIKEPIQFDVNKYDLLNKEIIIYEQKLKEKERIEKHNQTVQDEKNRDKDRIKFLQNKIDSLSYQVQLLKESRHVLDKEFSSYLIDKGTLFIKERMNEFFQRVYGRYEITFQQDKNSIDFFYGDGETLSPVGTSSGSERDILALGFRVSLSSLNNLGFMIFDEVDSQLSNDKAINLYNIIVEELQNEQLFVISHCEEVKEFILQQRGSKSFEIKEGGLIN